MGSFFFAWFCFQQLAGFVWKKRDLPAFSSPAMNGNCSSSFRLVLAYSGFRLEQAGPAPGPE
jgi:hypothetical protein